MDTCGRVLEDMRPNAHGGGMRSSSKEVIRFLQNVSRTPTRSAIAYEVFSCKVDSQGKFLKVYLFTF